MSILAALQSFLETCPYLESPLLWDNPDALPDSFALSPLSEREIRRYTDGDGVWELSLAMEARLRDDWEGEAQCQAIGDWVEAAGEHLSLSAGSKTICSIVRDGAPTVLSRGGGVARFRIPLRAVYTN